MRSAARISFIFIFIVLTFLPTQSAICATGGNKPAGNDGKIIAVIDSLHEQFRQYVHILPGQALDYSREALNLSIQTGDSLRIARSLFNVGESYRQLGDNLEAFDHYSRSSKVYKSLKNVEGIADSYDKLGVILRIMGDYANALSYHLKAIEISRKNNYEKGIANALVNSGIVYRNLGKDDISLKQYNEALLIAKKVRDLNAVSIAYVSLGNVYYYRKDFVKALEYYDESLKISEMEAYQGENQSGTYNNIGNVYREKRDFTKALLFYNKSLEITETCGDKNNQAVTYKNIGITYSKMGNIQLCTEFLNKSLELANSIKLRRVAKEVLYEFYLLYQQKNNHQKALEYYTAYSAVKDSLFNQNIYIRLALAQFEHELMNKNYENQILEQDNKIQELKLDKEGNLVRYLVIIVFLILISASFLVWLYRLKSRANRELRWLNSSLEMIVQERTKKILDEVELRRAAQEQAEAANKTLKRWLANMSHEVRTPLNVINGMIEMIMKSDSISEQTASLEIIRDASHSLMYMIKNILDYSIMEGGTKIELKKEKFDINAIAVSSVKAWLPVCQSKNLEIQYSIDPSIPHSLMGDEDKLRQILNNLLSNAVKFTEKGEISLAISRIPAGDPAQKSVSVKFVLNDTGIGISTNKQKLIFKGFIQEQDSIDRKFGGIGIGLTISRHYVELMGGTMDLKSSKGKGSTFSFVLDFDVADEPVKQGIDNELAARRLKILVAEDNLLNAQVLRAVLTRMGHESSLAENGKEAIDVLTREYFDAVLMDIEMPEMDGIEATRVIRSGSSGVLNPNIPIIAVTAHALQDYERKSYEAGMNKYLTKPANAEKLSTVLSQVC